MGQRSHVLGTLLRRLPSVAVGVLAAVVTVLAIDHRRTGAPQAPSAAESGALEASRGERTVHRVVVDQQAFDRISALEQRVRELQETRPAPAAGAAAPAAAPPDPEEFRRALKELYTQLDQAHERDAPDPGWAPGATTRFVTGLNGLGEKLGFTLGPTDCKTTTCRATVTWGNYAAARATGAQLVEQMFAGLNCTQRINLEEPSAPSAPYTTHLYLDCAELRAGVADNTGPGQGN
jgi:hypothetical protein